MNRFDGPRYPPAPNNMRDTTGRCAAPGCPVSYPLYPYTYGRPPARGSTLYYCRTHHQDVLAVARRQSGAYVTDERVHERDF